MSEEHIEVSISPTIVSKASPECKHVKPRAVAGVTDKDLIERNVIAELQEDELEDESGQ